MPDKGTIKLSFSVSICFNSLFGFLEPVDQKENASPKSKMKSMEKPNTRQENGCFVVEFCDFDKDLQFSVILDSRSKLDTSWLDQLSDGKNCVLNI